MRPVRLLLICLLAAWILTSCRPPGPAGLVSTTSPAPSVTLAPSRPATTTATATGTSTPVPATDVPTTRPSAVPTRTPTTRPSPTATPSLTPTATPLPTLPPPALPERGEPLAFSLGWRLDANEHLMAATVDLDGREPRISLASLGRSIYDLSSDGSVRRMIRTRGPVYALARLEGGHLAAGDDAGDVTVLEGKGRELWQANLGSRVTALEAAPGGGVLAGGWDERLSLFDGAGELRWQADLGAPPVGIVRLGTQDGSEVVLAATLAGQVRAFDLQGTEVWRFHAGAPLARLGTAPADGCALALLGAQDGRLLALDAGGALRWQRALGTGAPVWHAAGQLDQGQPGVAVGTGGATPGLSLLSAGTGQVRWHVSLPAAAGAVAALDLDGDGTLEILAGLADGQVQAHDLAGRQRGAVHAGLPVWGLYPAGEGSALVLADVVAWHLVGGSGPTGGPWLSPPAMLPAPTGVPLAPGDAASLPEEAEGGILVFLGDVAFGRSMEAQLARYGPAYPWQGLGPLLHGGDPPDAPGGGPLPVLVAANLECSLTTRGEPLDKGYLIRAHPLWAQSLVAGGIDLVTLANNHALDFRLPGLEETSEALAALGVETVGAGSSSEEAHRPALLELGGLRVAFLGYAAARWDGSADVPATDRLAWARPGEIRADVRAVRDQADIVVVLLHAGTEYADTPSADQVAAAHSAIDAGADLVVGHHPHVTQTVERYRRGLIVYSLGDAVFDIPRQAAMRGHLLRVRVTPDGLAAAELWPFWIDGAVQPRLLDDGQGAPQVEQIYP